MKTWQAILFTFALLFLVIILSGVIQFDLTWPLVLGTSLWVALDSRKIELLRYQSGISLKPLVLFIACALLWIVGFPWYLSMRYKIKNGTATLKDGPPPITAA
jgi:hypothetical protein